MTVPIAPSFARCQAIEAPMMPAPATTTRSPLAARTSGASAAAATSCRKRRRLRLAAIVDLALEPVVAIAAPSAHELPCARGQVRGKEERAPGFVLAHVDVFVIARGVERRSVGAEYHVAESDRAKRKAACRTVELRADPAAGEFKNTAHDESARAEQVHQEPQHEADECIGAGPDISNDPADHGGNFVICTLTTFHAPSRRT